MIPYHTPPAVLVKAEKQVRKLLWQALCDAAYKTHAEPLIDKRDEYQRNRYSKSAYPKGGTGIRAGARYTKQKTGGRG
jgi:hypothetical protein